MSKIKSPRDKKAVSLNRDRRNTYGENDKSSRRNIPLSKQRSNQAERRAAKQPLVKLTDQTDEDEVVAVEMEVKARAVLKRRQGFRKSPDSPLKAVIDYKKTGVWPRGYPL
jgi:hypothetical protein